MASDNPAINFLEYMKGVGDSAVNVAKEGAYGVYDFGQVAVGGAKIAAKEGLSALGATGAAAKISIEDIEPLSSLGMVAAQGGYQGLGNAIKSMPGNVTNAVISAAQQGDMRALGSSVTDAAFLVDGAAGLTKGVATGITKAATRLEPAAAAMAETVSKTVDKAKAALGKAKNSGNPEIANEATATCSKKNDVASRKTKRLPKQNGTWEGKPGESNWYSDIDEVNEVTTGKPVPFKNGRPDFSEWSKGEVTFEKGQLKGTDEDFSKVYERIAEQKGLKNKTAAKKLLSELELTPHHLDEVTIQLIPTKLHSNIPHVGSASDIRNSL